MEIQERTSEPVLAGAAIGLIVGVLFYTCTQPANAHERSVQLWLARYCVSEAGFQIDSSMEGYTNDCAAIAQVLRSRSSVGRVTIGIMQAYSRRLFNPQRDDERCYIPHLHLRREIPDCWPSHLSWDPRYRRRFLEIYELSGKILQDEVRAPCSPDHWGSPSLRRRVLRETNWTRADCGNTANDFWNLPSN